MEFIKKLVSSKIFWVNVIGFAIQLVQLISGLYPIDPTILALIQGLLTMILRQLQGVDVKLGGKKFTL